MSLAPNLPDPPAPDDALHVAALYVAGALEQPERDDFEARLLAGDQDLRRALELLHPAQHALLTTAPEIEPPAHLRAALEARLSDPAAPALAHEHHNHHDVHDHDDAGDAPPQPVVVMRHQNIRWRPTGLPGVRGCTLLADRKANRRTILLNMAPGSHIPDHVHGGIEEVMVLEGDLSIGDINLNARDYFCARPGSRHGEPRTTGGCIALVFSSYSAITTKTKLAFAIDALRTMLRLRGKRPA
ncbi:MAG: cupin domain-containing protein [Planctomycetota bacterium]|nr:cupin domain-containing protein [Planctomycetota bacterium]